MITDQDIETRFTYHPPPNDEAVARYTVLRGAAKQFALMIRNATPEGREQALAITNLEQCVMWANAAIARKPAS